MMVSLRVYQVTSCLLRCRWATAAHGVLEYWNKFILYYLNYNDSKEWDAEELLYEYSPGNCLSSCHSEEQGDEESPG